MSVTRKNVLETLSFARLGSDLSFPENERALFDDICTYARQLPPDVKAQVTEPAIRKWIYKDKVSGRRSEPKRIGALRFLSGYLKWIIKHRNVKDNSVQDELTSFFASFANDAALRSYDYADARGGPPEDWRGDQDTWESAQSLSDIYQIIRPSASRIKVSEADQTFYGNYVAEALCISALRNMTLHRSFMYSHKYVQSKYLYRGSLDFTTRSMFALLSREHTDFSERFAFRSVIGFTYNATECFSGILVRGMSDGSGAGKRDMAVPFVAMRTFLKEKMLEDLEPKALSNKLEIKRLGETNLICGELTASEPVYREIYSFCSRLFSELNSDLHLDDIKSSAHPNKELVVTTTDTRTVKKALQKALAVDDGFFKKWGELVASCAWDKAPRAYASSALRNPKRRREPSP